ncbi:MAG: alpha/beta fold hydrolase [Betaproteobacteria bacterium]|nr:alpha/beta fold hydrolase [Betaproteobacteria bacterium]
MTDEARPAVVLVHGYGMTGLVMSPLGLRLARCGFATRNFTYRDVRAPLAENAERLSRFVESLGCGAPHLVGHSLGGLLILRMLADQDHPAVGRAVLLGTPCCGSFAARWLYAHGATRWIVGKSVRSGILEERPGWTGNGELGVIAGTRPIGLGRLIPGLPRPNDGLVTVEETRLPGATDRIALKVSHTEMLVSGPVARQVCAFLRDGKFRRPIAQSPD